MTGSTSAVYVCLLCTDRKPTDRLNCHIDEFTFLSQLIVSHQKFIISCVMRLRNPIDDELTDQIAVFPPRVCFESNGGYNIHICFSLWPAVKCFCQPFTCRHSEPHEVNTFYAIASNRTLYHFRNRQMNWKRFCLGVCACLAWVRGLCQCGQWKCARKVNLAFATIRNGYMVKANKFCLQIINLMACKISLSAF